ncbi:MAG: CFI-box-CTERM domain-containing protein [Solirubrobacteraceae bacterium]|nr:CFI-box-CTERM domain-containing protein [Solirubrobacteraceae bacterium]
MFGRKKKKHKTRERAADTGCCIVESIFDGCYVATAAHGDFDAPEVVVLRQYRDERLRVRPVGRAFSWAYYRFGPYPAAVIDRVPELRAPARQLLRPAVWWAKRKLG